MLPRLAGRLKWLQNQGARRVHAGAGGMWRKHQNEPMNRYEFSLHISSDAHLDYYRGNVRHLIVRCASGQTVQFPASLFQRFVTTEGIHGNFVLTCDEHFKNLRLGRHTSHDEPPCSKQ